MSKRAHASGKLGPWAGWAVVGAKGGPAGEFSTERVAAIRAIEGELEAQRATLSQVLAMAALAARHATIEEIAEVLHAAGHAKAAKLIAGLRKP